MSQREEHGFADHQGDPADRRFASEKGLEPRRFPSDSVGAVSRNSHDVCEVPTGTVCSGPQQDALARFFDKTKRLPNGCLVWTAFRSPRGYGRFQATSKRGYQAHRWIYEQTHGPVSPDLSIDHLCRNRACVEVTHLEAVPFGVNTLRGEGPTAQNKRKTHCDHGHPLDGANLKRYANGNRKCVTCHRASAILSKLRRGKKVSAGALEFLARAGLMPHRAVTNFADPSGHAAPTGGAA